MRYVIFATALLVVGFASFYAGVQVGGHVLFAEDAPYRAVVAAGALSHLRSGRVESAASVLEHNLDGNVYAYVDRPYAFLAWVFPEVGGDLDRREAMMFVATYRREYANHRPRAQGASLSADERRSYEEYAAVIDSALSEYAPPHNHSLQGRRP